jgi:hypothetical protein
MRRQTLAAFRAPREAASDLEDLMRGHSDLVNRNRADLWAELGRALEALQALPPGSERAWWAERADVVAAELARGRRRERGEEEERP